MAGETGGADLGVGEVVRPEGVLGVCVVGVECHPSCFDRFVRSVHGVHPEQSALGDWTSREAFNGSEPLQAPGAVGMVINRHRDEDISIKQPGHCFSISSIRSSEYPMI